MKLETRLVALQVLTTMVTLLVLAGCSSKPPGCADEEVVTTMRGLILGSDSDDQVVQATLVATKLGLSEVVSEGYQSDAKKQLCRATVSVSLPNGESFNQVIQYSTQRTVDDKSNFLLTVENAQAIQMAAKGSIIQAARERRWGGIWTGEYRCTASVRAGDPGAEAYVEQVKAEIKGGSISLPLSGRNGIKQLLGEINEVDGSFSLRVPPMEARELVGGVHGSAKPDLLTGTGDVMDVMAGMDGLRLRTCEIRLQRGDSVRASVDAPTGSFNWSGSFVGEADGEVTLKVGKALSDGRYPVALATSTTKTGGGCGGAIEGIGALSGEELRVTASANGMTCAAVVKRAGDQLEVEEGKGCSMFHGAACSFSASLRRAN